MQSNYTLVIIYLGLYNSDREYDHGYVAEKNFELYVKQNEFNLEKKVLIGH